MTDHYGIIEIYLFTGKKLWTLQQQNQGWPKNIEKNYGIRYSVLIELPYFNPVRYAVIDPMHNLFLDTAKHCMQYWINHDILSKDNLNLVEQRVSSLVAPRSVGRLPAKITSGFAGFSADQWRNWTISFSHWKICYPVSIIYSIGYYLLKQPLIKVICQSLQTSAEKKLWLIWIWFRSALNLLLVWFRSA